jgi:hypothetical protein
MKYVTMLWSSLACVLFMTAAPTYAADVNSEIELLRSDIRATKQAIITKEMNFTEDQSKAFWPVYRKYENELAKLNDGKVALIKEYMAQYETMNDGKARKLLEDAFELDERTTGLMRKYAVEMGTLLPHRVVTRFFQLERRITRLVDLQIASALPMVR